MSTQVHEQYMRLAIQEALTSREEGNSGVGSVVVRDGEVIGRGRNLVATEYDVTGHAETVALRDAGAAQKTTDFSGCTLYTTFEPCPMCCGAILLAGISTLVVGSKPKPGQGFWTDYSVERQIANLGRSASIKVVSGVLADQCAEIIV